MIAAGKIALFLIFVGTASLVDAQVVRPYLQGRRRGGSQSWSGGSSFGLTPRRMIRPASLPQQQPRRRTTVLKQTVVVNDNTKVPSKSHNNRGRPRGPRRSPGGGTGTGDPPRSSSRGHRGSASSLKGGSGRNPTRLSFGGRLSVGRTLAREPMVFRRNPSRAHGGRPSHRHRIQILILPRGGGSGQNLGLSDGRLKGGGSGHNPRTNSGRLGHRSSSGNGRAGEGHLNHQLANLGLSVIRNPGAGLRTDVLAAFGSGVRSSAGSSGGSAGGNTGSRGIGTGAGASTGLNDVSGNGILASALGMSADLAELNNALNSLLGQSNQQNNILNSLLGQGNQQGALPAGLPPVPVPTGSISSQPISITPTSGGINSQALLGRLLGDNRNEDVLNGDANEHIIARLKVTNPQLLPPDA